MPLVLIPPTTNEAENRTSRHEPWIYNGEQEIAHLLRRRRIAYEYETRFYALVYTPPHTGRQRWGGFCPDFYLPATAERPALNLEVTFADHGRPHLSREGYQANQDRLAIKKLKIELTRQHYGVETILVNYRICLELRRDPRLLDRLIRSATTRHYRAQRQTRRQAQLQAA